MILTTILLYFLGMFLCICRHKAFLVAFGNSKKIENYEIIFLSLFSWIGFMMGTVAYLVNETGIHQDFFNFKWIKYLFGKILFK